MSNHLITPLSAVLKEGSDPSKNKWLARVIDSFNHFECNRNHSYSEEYLMDYIRNDAIDTEKNNLGRTYLYLIPKNDPTNCDPSKLKNAKELELVGFFELSLTTVQLNKVKDKEKKEEVKCQGHVKNGSLPLYCIAELARADKYRNELTGEEILQDAMSEISEAMARIGCGMVALEAETKVFEKFYKNHNFSEIQQRTIPAKYEKGQLIHREIPIVLAAAKLAEFDISACGTRS